MELQVQSVDVVEFRTPLNIIYSVLSIVCLSTLESLLDCVFWISFFVWIACLVLPSRLLCRGDSHMSCYGESCVVVV